MSTSELQIVLQTKVITYLYDSLPLCILLSNRNSMGWFYNHYNDLCLVTATDVNGYNCHDIKYAENGIYLDYCSYKEALIVNPVEGERVCQSKNIIEFIKVNIKSENYIISFSDWSVLPQSSRYQCEPFAHELLIYGYDDTLQNLKCITFNQDRKFDKIDISYSDYVASFNALYEHLADFDADFWTYLKFMYLIKPLDQGNNFSLSKFKESLQDFCAGKLSEFQRINLGLQNRTTLKIGKINEVEQEMDETWKYYFGVNVYVELCNVLDNNRLRYGCEHLNFLEYHIIYEHTNLMLERLNYLYDNYYGLKDAIRSPVLEYKKAVKISEMLRMYVMKYNTQYNLGLINADNAQVHIEKIKNQILQIKEIEESVLKKIIDAIENSND